MDHVMALMRLWWTCEDGGTYVAYPMEDLMGILALESYRHQCLVVGEDLGTVHEQVRSAMELRSILSCKPLMFESQDDGSVTPPECWPAKALATFGTHDLPTLAGFWQAADIAAADSASSNPARLEQLKSMRHDARAGLLAALVAYGLLDADQAADLAVATRPTAALVRAIHMLLARTPCLLLGVALEDLTGQVEQVNQPGTTDDQHPNWRRKLAASVEQLALAPAVADVLVALRRELLNPAA
jgi:(1->4)-alpha-D-glucan 1-alpha-D-glucosylmutase